MQQKIYPSFLEALHEVAETDDEFAQACAEAGIRMDTNYAPRDAVMRLSDLSLHSDESLSIKSYARGFEIQLPSSLTVTMHVGIDGVTRVMVDMHPHLIHESSPVIAAFFLADYEFVGDMGDFPHDYDAAYAEAAIFAKRCPAPDPLFRETIRQQTIRELHRS